MEAQESYLLGKGVDKVLWNRRLKDSSDSRVAVGLGPGPETRLRGATAGAGRLFTLGALLLALGACAGDETTAGDMETPMAHRDVHSFARPDEVSVAHLELDLTVDFEAQRLSGRASLTVERRRDSSVLHLDTRDLDISRVTGEDGGDLPFTLGDEVPFLGQELVVELGPETQTVHIDYATRPWAAALQWLRPAQTAGGKKPFLFTQSQAILARTWVPCQDTPGVRMTYEATIRVPPDLRAVMSAENSPEARPDGVYHFDMPQAIPSYLLALAVGELEFRPLGPQSGVYAEPTVVEEAAWEFADTEAMMAAASRLYGPYRWGRYDILVLPPSFPFGGMENPRLTFATPTILAGDRSLVSLIAHELAHSWSGNLVTNANWNDFWLNEGFTVYLERRIMEEIEGREYAEMLAQLGLQDLQRTLAELGPESRDSHLHLDLEGRDPDEGMNDVAYEKGYFFLRSLEEAVGRDSFDAFLRNYFDRFALQSLTTEAFLQYLNQELLENSSHSAEDLQLQAWAYGPGLPSNVPTVSSDAFDRVDETVAAWSSGTPAAGLDVEGYTTHHWLHFLRGLPSETSTQQMAELDAAFHFTESKNSEILHAWLLQAVDRGYEAAFPALESFLTRMGRRKFLRPLYEHLMATPEGQERARRIYAGARSSYHSVSTTTLDEIVGWEG